MTDRRVFKSTIRSRHDDVTIPRVYTPVTLGVTRYAHRPQHPAGTGRTDRNPYVALTQVLQGQKAASVNAATSGRKPLRTVA